jgi:GNAT superfamily N-acetyltransferase
MLTLVFRPLETSAAPNLPLDALVQHLGDDLQDLSQATVIATITPVLEQNREIARHIRWQTHNTRSRLVLETTWHHGSGLVMVDAHLGASPYLRHTALWLLCRHAGRAGYTWAATWQEGTKDPFAESLGFWDAATWADEAESPQPPMGRLDLGDDLVLEWLHPSPRIMRRLVYFAEECKIDWEYLIVEDLMTDTPATYLELRQGRETVALARVLRDCFLPGMEGYDPRSKTPPVRFEIESLETHPKATGKGYGARLVQAVQQLQRPVSTLDTYRRAERFWEHMNFRRNARRSAREDSNIFEWSPRLGKTLRLTFGDAE